MRRALLIFLLFMGAASLALWGTSQALTPVAAGPAEAPDPKSYNDAVVQVYGADVWGFRGNFAIHTWVATKARGDSAYRIYQVIGWRLRRGQGVVSIETGMPDRPWFRSPPILLYELKGPVAQQLIEPIHAAALSYPYDREYTMWPGPNSNSFTEWIARKVPELGLELPAKAIGKSWMAQTLEGT
jgi:hypothetical protein